MKEKELLKLINNADKIIIGAGSGLSTSAGFTYTGERFNKYFKDFIEKYHFKDLYSASFYPYPNDEEYWSFWSRLIYYNRYIPIPNKTYDYLLELVKDKDYFIITTNVDHCFQKSGFSKERLFYTQGDYGLCQCPTPCHNKVYSNEKYVKEILTKQKNMQVPTNLIPKCPKFGKTMIVNLRSGSNFVETNGWYEANNRYESFLDSIGNKKVLFLDLGTGYNTPGIFKYPFWNMTLEYNANYISINQNDITVPKEIKNKSLCIKEDITKVLKKVLELKDEK